MAKFLVVMLLAVLLTSCGNDASSNNNFEVYNPANLTEIPISGEIAQQLLNSKDTSVVNQSVKVYNTTRSLKELGDAYGEEMIKRGWYDATIKLTGTTELGSQGVIRAFEKNVSGDAMKKHVLGVIVISPDVKTEAAQRIRTTQPQATDNMVIVIQGAKGIPAAS